MVSVRWRKMLERSGLSQRALAKKLGVNFAELNLVVQGRAFLTPDKFKLACEYLDCVASDIYTYDVIEMMYGMKPREKSEKRDVRVRLDEDVLALIDITAKHNHRSRTQTVNDILRRLGEVR